MSAAIRLAELLEDEGLSAFGKQKAAKEFRRLDALAKEQAQIIEERDREIEELQIANQDFAQLQDWWNDRMFELEQELERLRAQRVPLTEEEILHALSGITNEPPSRLPIGWKKFARAIEAAHGIHPLQRPADLSKKKI